MLAAELQSPHPQALAARWSTIIERPVTPGRGGAQEIALDLGVLRFVQATDGRGEGLSRIDLKVADRQAILKAAERQGKTVADGTVTVCGTRFRLVA
jgi:hypothetical protein